MIRILCTALALGMALAASGASGASTAYPSSDALAQQCTTQACRDCVSECDRALDDRMDDCARHHPLPTETQEMCFYWAMSDHYGCLQYECGL